MKETYFTARSNLLPYAFVWEKGKSMDFSETIVVYDLKLATDARSDKKFLLTSKLCPLGAVCPMSRGYIHVLNQLNFSAVVNLSKHNSPSILRPMLLAGPFTFLDGILKFLREAIITSCPYQNQVCP